MKSVLIRMRASIGQLTLLAALTIVAGALLTGGPRVANELTDQALRERITSLPYQVKDLTFRLAPQPDSAFLPHHGETRRRQQFEALVPAFRAKVGNSWYAATAPVDTSVALSHGLPSGANFGVRAGTGYREQTRLVAGRWPDNALNPPRLEVAIAQNNAKILNFQVGTDYTLTDGDGRAEPIPVRIVGIVEPLNPRSAIWENDPWLLQAYVPQEDGETYLSTMMTDIEGMDRVANGGVPVAHEWRFRVDVSTLDMANLPQTITAVFDSRKVGVNRLPAETGLDTALARFADNARAAQALFAVVQAGALATLAGLVLLASALAVNRRRQEFTLMRARGASMRTVAAHVLVEMLPVIPLAAWIGYYGATYIPGRHAQTEVFVIGFAALALTALPLMAMASLRGLSSFSQEREDLATARIGLKRRTAELSLLVLAALGIFLLRRRGLPEGIDFYLVTVPVLLAAATAIVTLRAVPGPLGLASRIAAKARGAVSFLGLARAGRAAPATVGPIAVLVVAVCTTVFSLAIAGTVGAGRQQATDHDLPGDLMVKGFFFMPDTTDELRRIPGVDGVAPFTHLSAATVMTSMGIDAQPVGQFSVLMVDTKTLTEVARQAGRDITIPAIREGSPVIPALISEALQKELGQRTQAAVDIQGRRYEFQAASVVESFPTIARTSDRFMIIPLEAMTLIDGHAIRPNGFIIAGNPDLTAVRAAADAGQTRFASQFGPPRPGYQPLTQIVTWLEKRQQMERTGVNGVLTFAFTIGATGGVLMALLAVGFAVLAGARARGKVLSRLRTMGLSRRQGRRLLLIELAPVITIGVLTGGAVGLALPRLIAPALNLASFTDGYDAGIQLDPTVIGGAIGLVLAGLGTALLVETLFNRRLRLGEVLRLGSGE